MSTHVSALIESISTRWEEIDVLLVAAHDNKANEKLYDAICRSIIVLMTAQFEGFIKECIKAIVEDANLFSEFKALPKKMKRAFVVYLVKAANEDKSSNDLNNRVVRLTNLLDDLETKIHESAYLFISDSEVPQKNPTPTFINKFFSNFIDDDFFQRASQSELDVAFENNSQELQELKDKLVEHVTSGVFNYPYTVNCTEFGLQSRGPLTKRRASERTLWEDFLDQIFTRRHSIAHGSSLENVSSIAEIREFKEKIQTLQYALLLVLSHHAVDTT